MKPTQADLPQVFSDRDSLSSLECQAEGVVEAMRQCGLGRIDERETVHFCGLVHNPKNGNVVLLPREARTGNHNQDMKTAKLTMRSLARFGAEVSKREFEDDGEIGSSGALSVVKRLADDFRAHGLFSERTRLITRNSGKPDWGRTVTREIAMLDQNDQPVFTNIRTSRAAKSSEALLAQIQAAVLREIIAAHGWWLPGAEARKADLLSSSYPQFHRSGWAGKLDSLLSSLYSTRSIFLAKYLRHYLKETRATANGSFVFGVSDFHTVWETILRETLVRSPQDRGRNWNSELPKPIYVHMNDGSHDARRRGMQTDIILEDATGFTIVDAKYYAAKNAQSAPGWPDIAKQLFYEKALREIVEDHNKIQSVFVFPSRSNNGVLKHAEILHIDGRPTSQTFTSVTCHYVSVTEALDCYVRRIKGVKLPDRIV